MNKPNDWKERGYVQKPMVLLPDEVKIVDFAMKLSGKKWKDMVLDAIKQVYFNPNPNQSVVDSYLESEQHRIVTEYQRQVNALTKQLDADLNNIKRVIDEPTSVAIEEIIGNADYSKIVEHENKKLISDFKEDFISHLGGWKLIMWMLQPDVKDRFDSIPFSKDDLSYFHGRCNSCFNWDVKDCPSTKSDEYKHGTELIKNIEDRMESA